MNTYDEMVATVVRRASEGTSTTVLGIPGIGRNRFINMLEKKVAESQKSILIQIAINELVERSPESFYRLLFLKLYRAYQANSPEAPASSIFSQPDRNLQHSTVPALLDYPSQIGALTGFDLLNGIISLTGLLATNRSIILSIIDLSKATSFEKPFYATIYSIYTKYKSNFSILFIDTPDFRRTFSSKRAEDLYDQMMSSIIWLPLPDKELFDIEITHWENRYSYKITPQLKKFIWEQTGGHSSLTKYLFLYFYENQLEIDVSAFTEFYALNTRIEKMLKSLDTSELDLLRAIAYGQLEGIDIRATEDLIRYGLVDYDESNQPQITISVLKDYLLQERPVENYVRNIPENLIPPVNQPRRASPKRIEIKLKEGTGYIDGQPILPDLTQREYKLLEFLIKNRGNVVSRDRLATLIWGENAKDRYSDWSIDQTISRLRRKLGENGYQPQLLKTLRGRGFKLD